MICKYGNCRRLTSIDFPDSVTTLGYDAFDGTAWYSNQPDGLVYIGKWVYKYKANPGTNVVIEEGTLGIADNAFRGCSNLQTIIIPNSVKYIGKYAFGECSGLKSATLGNGMTNIGAGAFYYCSSLASISIPNSVENLEEYAFSGCSGLRTLTLGNGLTSISDYAFCECGIRTLVIPNSVKSIGGNAFGACKSLTTLTIPNSVESIGDHAFNTCSALTKLTIPNSVSSIGEGAFRRCAGLSSIVVENGNVNYDSRDNCNAIIETNTNTLIFGCKNTVIPKSVPTIGEYAFCGSSNLTAIVIPNSVTSIGQDAFRGCSGLTSVVIPNRLTNIENSVFFDCTELVSVVIPSSVSSIFSTAFQNCSNITLVKVKREEPISISSYLFENRTNATLYVPYGCKPAYEAAAYWKEFKEIIEIDNRLEQTFELAELPAMTYGDDTYELPATTVEGKTITWSSGDESIAAVSGNTITIKGAGTTTVTATQDGDDEYKPFSKEYELNIDKAQLTITADDCSMEHGSALPTFTLSYEGLVYDEDETVLTNMPIVATTATSESAVGTYPITVSGAESQNYEITYVNGTLSVTEASIVTDISQLTDAVYIEPMTAIAGTEVQMEIKLKNEVDVAGASFTVVLPKGMTLAKDEDGDLIYELNEERAKSGKFAVYWADGEDGSCGIRIMPTGTNTISGKEGTLLTLKLKLDETLDEGEHSVVLKENSLTVKDDEGQLSTLWLASTGTNVTVIKVMPGDVNRDYRVDLTDAIMIVYASLGVSQTGFIAKAADVNGDGRVDLTDAVIVVYKSLGVEPKSGMMARRADGEPVTTESFIIDDVTIPAGKSIELPICFSADADSKIVGFQLNLNLPDGVTTVKDEDALPVFIKNETLCNKLTFYPTENDGFAALPQTTSAYVKGSEGILFSVELKADESLTPGTKLTGTVTNAMFTVKDEDGSMRSVDVADFSFGISIVDKTTVGIDDISRESVNDGYYYNLNGQRVDVPRKGLYIMNGKKVRR